MGCKQWFNRNLAPHTLTLPRGLLRLSQRTMVEFTRLAAGKKLLLQQGDIEIVELRKGTCGIHKRLCSALSTKTCLAKATVDRETEHVFETPA